jgi:hypothetical protein
LHAIELRFGIFVRGNKSSSFFVELLADFLVPVVVKTLSLFSRHLEDLGFQQFFHRPRTYVILCCRLNPGVKNGLRVGFDFSLKAVCFDPKQLIVLVTMMKLEILFEIIRWGTRFEA